jgi:hypothetical protein
MGITLRFTSGTRECLAKSPQIDTLALCPVRLALNQAVPHSQQQQSTEEGTVNPVALCNSGILRIEALCPEIGDEPPLSSSFPHLKPKRCHHSPNRALPQPVGMSLAPQQP